VVFEREEEEERGVAAIGSASRFVEEVVNGRSF